MIKSIKDKAIDQSVSIAEAELLKKAKNSKSSTNIDQSLKDVDSVLKRL